MRPPAAEAVDEAAARGGAAPPGAAPAAGGEREGEDHDLGPAVTNATFRDEVIAPHNDVLVKVYASWSRASSELAKPYAQVAYYFDSKGESREQKLLVTKIDGSRYKVPELDAHALPSLFLFPRYDKRHALRYEGDLSYDSIVKCCLL